MDRIAAAFDRARREKRACFVAYLCGGDPDFATSLRACEAVIEGGADILEIGVPFSDPLADGLTNQLAAQRALESGMTMSRVFELAAALRRKTEVPIVFYTYYNLVFANGMDTYVKRARDAGVDGMLTLDLPPEEADDLLATSRAAGMKNIFIVAPTTSDARLATIAQAASGFIYYVSREGVTGVRESLADNIRGAVTRIRAAATSLPVVVGFGISSRAQVHEIAGMADGAVVGSALVNCIRDHLGQPEAIVAALREKTRELSAGVRQK